MTTRSAAVPEPETTTRSDSRSALLDAAERLVAVHGPDIPLREIALAAGQKNNSAVQYHFGSRDGLVEAVLDRRLRPMEKWREQRLDELERQGRSGDVAGLVEVLVAPMLLQPYEHGATHYARFVDRVRHTARFSRRGPADPSWPQTARALGALRDVLPLSGPALGRRLENVVVALFALIAEEERRRDDPGQVPSSVEEIVVVVTAMLTAP